MENVDNKTTQEESEVNLKAIIPIIAIIWGACCIFQPHLDDFAAKYASKHDVSRSMIMNYVTCDYHLFPVPYTKYVVQHENGIDKNVGYGILGTIILTNKIE